jgi:tetratricopeptide (TPR) repeat protein
MSRFRALLAALLILAAGLWVYWPALHGGWVWDDVEEVTQNAVLRDPAGLARIWTAPAGADYFPLKTTVQWVEWRCWGDAPAGYHAVSIALHLLSALLFWRLLRQLGLRFAWVGGLLFAVHPLAVESVAWAAELKNTLSLALLLPAMILYLEFDQKGSGRECLNPAPGFQHSRPDPFYWTSLLFFVLALLSKTSVAMFPAVILLHAWWRRDRIDRRDLRASAPFFAASLGLGLVTWSFQSQRALASWTIPWGGPASRVAVAGLNLAFYLWKSLWPAGLLPVYPQWRVAPPALVQYLPWAGLALLVGWLWSRRATWGRGVLFGLGFFVLNLLPVLGFVPMAYLHLAWAADHLAYLPLLGLVGLAVAGLGRCAFRPGMWALVAAAAAALAWQSRRQVPVFHDEATLWTRTLEGNPSAWLAHNNLGNLLVARGDADAGIRHFAAALRLYPDYAEAQYDWGLALALEGRLPEAVPHYEAALRLEPESAAIQTKLGNALLNLGRPAEAAIHYREALRRTPGNAEAEGNLGVALAQLGALPEAIGHEEAALRLDPGYLPGRVNLGNALARAGRPGEAILQYEAALRLGATGADLHFNLATALLAAGRRAEAIEQYEAELRLRPGDDETRRQVEALRAGEER